MIEVKEAVRIAIDYLKQLYDNINLHDILLEEVALSDDEKSWFVTLGFSRAVSSPDPLRSVMETALKQMKYQREYKVFQVDSTTGQVKSMKIRAA